MKNAQETRLSVVAEDEQGVIDRQRGRWGGLEEVGNRRKVLGRSERRRGVFRIAGEFRRLWSGLLDT